VFCIGVLRDRSAAAAARRDRVPVSERAEQDRADENKNGADHQYIEFQGKLHEASLCHGERELNSF
jgi:hypothetical protein